MLEPLKRRDRGIARRHRGELRPHRMWSVASHGSGRANAARAAEAASKILIPSLKWRGRSGAGAVGRTRGTARKSRTERSSRRGSRNSATYAYSDAIAAQLWDLKPPQRLYPSVPARCSDMAHLTWAWRRRDAGTRRGGGGAARRSKRRKESVPTSTLGCSRAAGAARQRHCQTLWMWSVASRGSGRANAAQAAEAASRILISSLKRETGAERE